MLNLCNHLPSKQSMSSNTKSRTGLLQHVGNSTGNSRNILLKNFQLKFSMLSWKNMELYMCHFATKLTSRTWMITFYLYQKCYFTVTGFSLGFCKWGSLDPLLTEIRRPAWKIEVKMEFLGQWIPHSYKIPRTYTYRIWYEFCYNIQVLNEP